MNNTPHSPLILTAIRNVNIMCWWDRCSPEFHSAVRALYATELECPECELGDDDTFIQDSDVLAWVADTYPNALALWEEDNL